MGALTLSRNSAAEAQISQRSQTGGRQTHQLADIGLLITDQRIIINIGQYEKRVKKTLQEKMLGGISDY